MTGAAQRRAADYLRSLARLFAELTLRFPLAELQALQYQDMPVLPVMEEILEGSRFHIEPNTRTYKDAETYIQTHFMLLREDYVDPVREGIKAYLARKHSEKDVHVYLKVKVVGLVSARDGLVYRLKMPLSKSIQWDKTRRLMNGSLLALTLDSFETVVWAVVYNRAEDVIKDSMIDVQLVNDGAVGSFSLPLAP